MDKDNIDKDNMDKDNIDKDNISNIDKTEKYILDCFSKFNNINIVLDRISRKYETEGRIQTEDEAKDIDIILKHLLNTIK